MDEKTALSYAIARALAYQENGGKIDLNNIRAGKTGELKSIYQFTPATWKNYAKEVLGDQNAELTPDNEVKVVVKKVGDWIDKGYNVKQIASVWNAGASEPDAFTGKFSNGRPSKGINKKYGVPYDVPKYADNVANYARDFYKTDFAPQVHSSPTAATTPQAPQAERKAPTPTPKLNNGLMGSLVQFPMQSSTSLSAAVPPPTSY